MIALFDSRLDIIALHLTYYYRWIMWSNCLKGFKDIFLPRSKCLCNYIVKLFQTVKVTRLK